MKIRIASILLLLAVLPWWLTACTQAEPTQRPRLLASNAARIATMNQAETLGDATADHSGEPMAGAMSVRVTSCAPPSMEPALAPSDVRPAKSKAPRLVIGEPACMSVIATAGPRRID